jgi:hypothetical protein
VPIRVWKPGAARFNAVVGHEKMKTLFRKLRVWFFPPTSRREAIEIARKEHISKIRTFRAYRRKPANINIYNLPSEPCWFICAPWNDGENGNVIRSSHVILVSKLTGEVLYDGSGSDEG